jgi:hypothetical protein
MKWTTAGPALTGGHSGKPVAAIGPDTAWIVRSIARFDQIAQDRRRRRELDPQSARAWRGAGVADADREHQRVPGRDYVGHLNRRHQEKARTVQKEDHMAVELNDTTIPATYQLAERTGTLPARGASRH